MLTCGLVLLILAAEAGIVYAWRQRRFPRPAWAGLFGPWTWAIYVALLLVGLALGWAGNFALALFDPSAAGTRPLIDAALLVAFIALIVVVAFTLFFRWVIHSDITDIPD